MSPSSPSGRSFFHPDKATDKTHLFVSIYNDRPPTSPATTASQEEPGPPQQSHHHHRHHALNHRWTVLVEQPHKPHHRLSLQPHSHKDTDPGPILFLIGRDNNATSSWACHSRHAERADDENLIGKIHIGDCDAKLATTVRIEEVLRARLLPPEGDGAEEEGGRTSEHWIRAAVHALQDGGLVDKFDLDDFMTFARTYVAERAQVMTGEAAEDLAPPAAIEYVHVVGSGDGGGHGDGKKHGGLPSTAAGGKNLKTTSTGRRGFWLSWPHSTPNSPARSREASPYGGLM